MLSAFVDCFNEINHDEALAKIKNLTPKQYIRFNAAEKLELNVLLASLDYKGLIDIHEVKQKLEPIKKTIKWIAKKDDETLYFSDHKEISQHFGYPSIQALRNAEKTGAIDYQLQRVHIELIMSKDGEILQKNNKKYHGN